MSNSLIHVVSFEVSRGEGSKPANPSIILFPYGITGAQAAALEDLIIEQLQNSDTDYLVDVTDNVTLHNIIGDVCKRLGLVFEYPTIGYTVYL